MKKANSKALKIIVFIRIENKFNNLKFDRNSRIACIFIVYMQFLYLPAYFCRVYMGY